MHIKRENWKTLAERLESLSDHFGLKCGIMIALPSDACLDAGDLARLEISLVSQAILSQMSWTSSEKEGWGQEKVTKDYKYFDSIAEKAELLGRYLEGDIPVNMSEENFYEFFSDITQGTELFYGVSSVDELKETLKLYYLLHEKFETKGSGCLQLYLFLLAFFFVVIICT